MLAKLRPRLSYANVVSTLCLFVVLGGTSYAALVVTGADVRDGSLTGADIKNFSLDADDLSRAARVARTTGGPVRVVCPARAARVPAYAGRARAAQSVRCRLLGRVPSGPRGAQGPQGAPGERGPQGAQGERGAQGAQGPVGDTGARGERGADGSPDSPQQVLDKLRQVDGSGSDLDADRLDGTDSTGFLRIVGTNITGVTPGSVPGNTCDSLSTFRITGLQLTDFLLVQHDAEPHDGIVYEFRIEDSPSGGGPLIRVYVCNTTAAPISPGYSGAFRVRAVR